MISSPLARKGLATLAVVGGVYSAATACSLPPGETEPFSAPAAATPTLRLASPPQSPHVTTERAHDPLPTPPPEVLAVGNGVTPPVILYRVMPDPPQGIVRTGLLLLRAIVEADGSVSDVTVLRDRTQPPLGPAHAEALRQWRFEPAKLDGQPVRVYYDISVTIDVR